MISTNNLPSGAGLGNATSGKVAGNPRAEAVQAGFPSSGKTATDSDKASGDIATVFAQLVAALTAAAEQQEAPQDAAQQASGSQATAPQAVVADAAGSDETTGGTGDTIREPVEDGHTTPDGETAERPQAPPAAGATDDELHAVVLPHAAQQAATAKPQPGNDAAYQRLNAAAPAQPQAGYTSANALRSEPSEAVDLVRQRTAGGGPLVSQPLLFSNSGDNAKELLASALSGQRSAAPAAPLSTGGELRLDAVQQLMRPGQAEWAPVKVDTQSGQWSRELMAALGDRLSMQINQNVKEATVRLDPPDLGRIELVVRMDGDRLNVQLNASNTGVRDLLTQHAERLRNDLLQQNLQTVDVQVGQQSQRDNSGRYQPQQQAIAANLPLEPEQDVLTEDNNNRWLSTSA